MSESDFENDLRKLRPVSPSARLERAIAAELNNAHEILPLQARPRSGAITRPKERMLPRLLSGLCWASGGAVAAIAAMLWIQGSAANLAFTGRDASRQSSPAADNLFEAAESSQELIDTEDAGLVYTEEQEPTRVVRYNSMERYVWANPTTGARVELEVPREDVVLIPVSFQ